MTPHECRRHIAVAVRLPSTLLRNRPLSPPQYPTAAIGVSALVAVLVAPPPPYHVGHPPLSAFGSDLQPQCS